MRYPLIITIVLSLFTTTVLAKKPYTPNVVKSGFYIGIDTGYSHVAYNNHIAPGYTARSVTETGFAQRIETGFDIWKNLGAFLSVIYFDKPEFHQINGPTNSKIKNNLIFFALKGMLPIGHRFVINANGGVGYIARSSVTVNGIDVLTNREIVRPVYGLGFGYLLWKRWIVALTWIEAPEKSSEHLPTSDFVGLGLRYKFSS